MNLGLADRIVNEKDPYLREIYALGYDEVVVRYMEDKVILIDRLNQKKKEFFLRDFQMTIYECSIIKGVTLGGEIHAWVKESDGSADKLRNFISSSL